PADRPHLGYQPAQDAAIGAEYDEVELHAIDRGVGFVLVHEIEPATIFDGLDGIELDEKFSFRRQGSVRSQKLRAKQRRQDDPHIVSSCYDESLFGMHAWIEPGRGRA